MADKYVNPAGLTAVIEWIKSKLTGKVDKTTQATDSELGLIKTTVSSDPSIGELIVPGFVLGSVSMAYVSRLTRTSISDFSSRKSFTGMLPGWAKRCSSTSTSSISSSSSGRPAAWMAAPTYSAAISPW